MKRQDWLWHLELNREIMEEKEWCSFTWLALCKFWLSTIKTLYDITYSFIIHILSNLFKLINIATVIWTITAIAYWISITTKDSYSVNEEGTIRSDMIDTVYSQILELRTYKSIWSVLFMLMCINLMQYFTFSVKLSMFYEIVNKAILDIVFFFIIFLSVILSYSLIDHLVFGLND